MAERQPSVLPVGGGEARIEWSGIKLGDTCAVHAIYGKPSRHASWRGTWGGATLALAGGSVRGAAMVTLVDSQGNALSKGADADEEILDTPELIQPVLTNGDATTDLTLVVTAQ